jgi:hypothetical protein
MKRDRRCGKVFITLLVYSLAVLPALLNVSALHAYGEKTLVLGSSSGWGMAEKRSQVSELSSIRPHPVLALSSAWTGVTPDARPEAEQSANADILALYAAYRNFPVNENALDLALSFDEGNPLRFRDSGGRYRVEVSTGIQTVNERWARYGSGAALFSGVLGREEAPPVRIVPQNRNALFSFGRGMRDFSLEFWLYPNNLENGEQILAWSAVPPSTDASVQRIFCEAIRNRIRWTFQNFFISPNMGRFGSGPAALSISLETKNGLVPRNWSHHIIRYNADTGLLEYLVNGRIENIAYTTGSGREGGDVYTPYPGRDGQFILGGRFSGMLDEFRLYNRAINAPGRAALDRVSHTALELPELAKFPRNGRFETRTLDLGEPRSTVLKLEASGGRFTAGQAGRKPAKNSYAGTGNFQFPDNSAVQFFIRAGEEPYRFDRIPWMPVTPGSELAGGLRGRYIQIAAALYPSGDCETTPYLEEIRIFYKSNEAPYPPSLVTAKALDGTVELSWRSSPDANTAGYLLYYGTSSGVYYGEGAVLGGSPIDMGRRNSIRIDGLKNGTLYYFAITAYDGTNPDFHSGKFSKEVTARPLRTLEGN